MYTHHIYTYMAYKHIHANIHKHHIHIYLTPIYTDKYTWTYT